MDVEFWLERWERGEIGFHRPEFNPYLIENWPKLGVSLGSRVFVPLCGKSLDILWLRQQGHEVLGIEASEQAILEFVQEHGIQFTKNTDTAPFVSYQSDGITLLQGDYFQLTKAVLGNIDVVYDRAALVAMPPDMRPAYAAQMARLLDSGSAMLLISVAYPEQEMEGPPFNVSDAEVRELYQHDFLLQKIGENAQALDTNMRFMERGLSRLTENVWHLIKR